MATCQKCGKKYSIWSARGLGTGLCNECHTESTKAEEEKRKREEAEAKTESVQALPLLAQGFLPDVSFKVVGIAYWNTAGTNVRSVVAKVGFGALLGGFGMALVAKEHRVGVIGVTDNDLYVVDLGMIVGENVTLSKAKSAHGPLGVKRTALKDLTADYSESGYDCSLSLSGAMRLKATFPDSYHLGNKSKAVQIAAAVKAARA